MDGPAVLKNSNGSTNVGAVTGELRVSGANGAIDIACAEASVTETSTNGVLRVAEVVCVEIQLETSNTSTSSAPSPERCAHGLLRSILDWLDAAGVEAAELTVPRRHVNPGPVARTSQAVTCLRPCLA